MEGCTERKQATITFKIFESVDEIEHVKAFISGATIDTSFAGAYIVKRCKAIWIGEDKVRTAFRLFMEKFKASSSYKSSGRGTDVMGLAIAQKMIYSERKLFSSHKKLARHFTTAEIDLVNTQYLFGLSAEYKNVGMDFANIGSVKIQTTGKRRVILAPLDKVLAYLASTQAAGTSVSLEDAASKVREATPEDIKNMKSAGVTCQKIVIDEGDCVKNPWGTLVAEIVDNNVMVGGVRLLDVADAPTDGFNAILDVVLKGSQQKKGSLDFLRRLSEGLQFTNGAGASALKPNVSASFQTKNVTTKSVRRK